MFGDKSHHDQAQDHVPQQRHITAPLEVAEADLALGDSKRVFHVPARERHTQQLLYRRVSGRIREKVLHLLRGQVVSLAMAGARRVLEREVDAKTHGELLDQLAAKL